MSPEEFDNRPIGVFDSGVGGLTVAKALVERLPHESVVYFGDSKRCPYGPRSLEETRSFVRQICKWLLQYDVKLIIIACNTATAAGLEMAQQMFDVPVIGVVEPGARAAMRATRTRRVGVIATQATVDSEAYPKAIKALDAGIKTFSQVTPKFVEIAEEGLRDKRDHGLSRAEIFAHMAEDPEYLAIAEEYLEPLKEQNIDTLVMGCTHFPLLEPLISNVMGPSVKLISSARETANDVAETLERRGNLAKADAVAKYGFATTADDPDDFLQVGRMVFPDNMDDLVHVSLEELAALDS